MSQLVEKDAAKLYFKHHSFENFHSRIGSDPKGETARVLRLLKDPSAKLTGQKIDIAQDIIKQLSSFDKDSLFKITVHIADELSRLEDKDVVRYIIHRYRYDVFPKKFMLDDYPPYVQIEPASICNYRCVFCYQTDAAFTDKSSGFMGTMSLDLFKNIVDQIEGHVDFISLASRGEPLICKDIDKMLDYCVGKFLGLKMNTNASLLTEKSCHAILSGGINTIVFSADAAVEPLYSQLRVKGSLEKVLANIQMFKTIKEKQYPKSKIIMRVSGVKVNHDQEMDVMLKTWGELVEQVAFVAYNPWENVYESAPNKLETACSDLWRRLFVWFDGKANPCDTDYKSLLAVGNIKDVSISKLWRSKVYEQLRQQHLNKKRCNVFPCKGCVVV